MKYRILALVSVTACLVSGVLAQQRPQWMAGQAGLNAGVVLDPGFSFQNLTDYYYSNRVNGPDGKELPLGQIAYHVVASENISTWVVDTKIFGANPGFGFSVCPANGSVTEIQPKGGGAGLANTFTTPILLGWHFKHLDLSFRDVVILPTGRYTMGASNNVGSGFWTDMIVGGATYYPFHNKNTQISGILEWEAHGKQAGTDLTPGQAMTFEWGIGHMFPLNSRKTVIFDPGVVGYEQWQVSPDGGK